ncbi:MAG: 2-oxoacid:acceptor oxidoreductase family protein [Deltaproteobacteria bacterium]|nr:2-oxoacid:acceptor oxidoreductase family protein [Deltaproteobacteria bacterium]
MRRQIVVVGTGGQGIVLLARVLGEAGRREGVPVLTAETHGMAMRGGSVVCQVKLGDFASPLVLPGRADVLLGLDEAEAVRNRHYLAPGGASIINTPSPTAAGEVDALPLAREAGSPKILNMVLLGYAAGIGVLGLSPEALRAAVKAVSPAEHRPVNLAAFDRGFGAS